MRSKHRIVLHVDDVHCVLLVVLSQELQDFQFDSCLVIVLLLVLYYFQCNLFLRLVIQTFHCNTKAALTKKSDDLISIRNMVFQSYSIVTFAVVKPKIGVVVCLVSTWLLLIHHWLNLLDVLAEVVHLRVVKYFCAFILCQMVQLKFKHFGRRQGIRNVVNSLLLVNGSLLRLAVLYFPFV